MVVGFFRAGNRRATRAFHACPHPSRRRLLPLAAGARRLYDDAQSEGATRTRPESARGETTMKLEDKKLFRQQCYVAAAWQDAESGDPHPVPTPVDGHAHRPETQRGPP